MHLLRRSGAKTLLEVKLIINTIRHALSAGVFAGCAVNMTAPALADTALASSQTQSPREFLWQPEPGDEIYFDVFRNGSEFGHHIVRFEADEAGDIAAIIDVDLRAGLGPVTLFRYALDVRETWRDGHVLALKGKVNNDGERESVTARRTGASLEVDGTEFRGDLPVSIIPASHWNIWQTQADRILSTESGEVIEVDVKPLGRELIEAGGQTIEARKFLMDSDIDVTLWYDDQDRWVKLSFETRGQDIDYVLRALY